MTKLAGRVSQPKSGRQRLAVPAILVDLVGDGLASRSSCNPERSTAQMRTTALT